MVDFFEKTRLDLIKHLQMSLRTIRQLMGLSAQDLGNLIGLTRQTINNLENVKSQMTATQYVSLCAVIDDFTANKPELLPAISAVLEASVPSSAKSEASNVHNGSFLKKWFMCFSHQQGQGAFSLPSDNYDDLLKELAQNYKIFLDWNSLLAPGAERFVTNLVPKLLEANGSIIVPLRVVEYIQQMVLSADPEDSSEAQQAISLLGKLQKQGVVQIRGEKNDSNVYSTFISVFAKYKASYRLFLITQDEALAGDVIGMNGKESMSGFPIAAGYLADDGALVLYGESSAAEETETADGGAELAEEMKEMDGITIDNAIKGWDSIE